MLLLAPMLWLAAPGDTIVVDRDNIEITQSCTVRFAASPIVDADGNGVVHITGDQIAVDFGGGGQLRGSPSGQAPDTYAGIGVRVTGKDVRIRNLAAGGYKVAIYAPGADRLFLEDCRFTDNFRQRLKSTPQAEDGGDWLWPHNNDNREWMTNYGAAVCVENASACTIRRVTVRDGQNGIILDRVSRSYLYDNDCSFLSGWGLALWRSSENMISRNAFDFCIRGYSHGVYNRGQDSAGILMFEQCLNNTFAENSATHGGDGFFAFSGREALGEVNPREDIAWYAKRGNNDNDLITNDFSYAAAHGIELTFGFNNRINANRLVGNAICGVWGGYSQDTAIVANEFEANGEGAYGLERGGVNIEHGRNNLIAGNAFKNNKCGVHLWWDEDPDLLKTPWGKANNPLSADNQVVMNAFNGDEIAMQLRHCGPTQYTNNRATNVKTEIEADEESLKSLARPERSPSISLPPVSGIIGKTRPVGARADLRGRDKIVMTEWGPYDWERPLLQRVETGDGADHYSVLGRNVSIDADQLSATGDVKVAVEGGIVVRPNSTDTVTPYELTAIIENAPCNVRGLLLPGFWTVHVFPWKTDPRENVEQWRREASEQPLGTALDRLHLPYGAGGITELRGLPRPMPSDRFGTIAIRTLTFPRGSWRIKTTSDDGIRVWMDDKLVIDDWTWHGPTPHDYEFTVDQDRREVAFRVEHFEIDGYAILSVDIDTPK